MVNLHLFTVKEANRINLKKKEEYMSEEFNFSDVQKRMDGAINALKSDFSGLRAGRASVNMLDPIMVDSYGQIVPLKQVGSVSAPDSRMLTVTVWDKGNVTAICKAIINSGLGLNPQPDGTLIRLPIPELNEERRKDIIKQASKYAEHAKVSIRNVRRDALDMLKKLEKSGDLSEDEQHRQSEKVQKETDGHITKIDEILKQKEKDILTI
jgi:ribosome recycling factor